MTQEERHQTSMFISSMGYDKVYQDLLTEACATFKDNLLMENKYVKTLICESANTAIICFFNHIRKMRESTMGVSFE